VTARRHAVGLDYGTESVRAIVVDWESGEVRAEEIERYPHGVVTERLPGSDRPLPPDFALQHAGDYLDGAVAVLRRAVAKVPAAQIAAVGVDFTACTMLPVRRDGTPLMFDGELAARPHAWVKLWKHHGARVEAERVNEIARQRQEAFLPYYGGAISSEWMLPKCMETARADREIYDAAALFVDAGDWIVQQMTGVFSRSACSAGYKGLWSAELGFPSRAFLSALGGSIDELPGKWLTEVAAPGTIAGEITAEFASRSGLRRGTPVSVASIDAHSGVAGTGVGRPGTMVAILGTSACHMVLSEKQVLFPGVAGVVKDGILPGYYGYESGQAAVGDLLTWFARDLVGGMAADPFSALAADAARLPAGATGLLALDWWNGNRSVLMDSGLTGMMMGWTLRARPAHTYRALVESLALGTRVIVDAHQAAGIAVDAIRVCGGLAEDPFILRTFCDVLGLPVEVAASRQAVALGAAILGAAAASGGQAGHDRAAQSDPGARRGCKIDLR
jgi:L-ribulokinase